MCSWDDFEKNLATEFLSILIEFRKVKDSLTEDTRKDFFGLLQYIIKQRKSHFEIAQSMNLAQVEDLMVTSKTITDKAILIERAEFLLQNNLDSFAQEFIHFPEILSNFEQIPDNLLLNLCEKYWKCRYPSVKESFIIPLCSKLNILESNHNIYSLLTKRLLKGKLDPFDESVALCKTFQISPEKLDFSDYQLATLKDFLKYTASQSLCEMQSVLNQSGCHCD